MNRGSPGVNATTEQSASRWVLPFALAALWLIAGIAYLIHQETPIGGLRGVALAEETGRPLPGATIRLHRTNLSVEEESTSFVVHTRRDGSFNLRRMPAGSYRLEASSEAHRLGPLAFNVDEGEVREVTLELSPVPSYVYLNAAEHTFTPDEGLSVFASGFVRAEALDFQFYRVDPVALFTKHGGNLHELVHTEQPPEHLALEGNPALTPGPLLPVPITRRDVEGVFQQDFKLPRPGPGIYLVVARADSVEEMEWVVVTRLGLILKHWGDQAVAYVADLKTGQPVAGASVRMTAGAASAAGTTDRDGICEVRLALGGKGGERSILAWAEEGGSQAFVRSYSYAGAEGGEQDRVYSYTDRPLYRPGHVVNWKGIARRFADTSAGAAEQPRSPGYSVLAKKPVEVQVWDSRDSLVYKADLTTNEWGSFDGQFRLNDEAATGLYRLVATVDGKENESSFKVAEYRKPEYSVSVTTDKKRYTRGEQIRAEASAQYYFGAPVAGAEVSYLVRRTPYYFYPMDEEDAMAYEGEGAEYDYGEVIEEGNARTDAQGIAHLTVATKRPPEVAEAQRAVSEEEAQDYRYVIEVTVTDPSRKEVTAEGSTIVTQGDFALLAHPLTYIAAPAQAVAVSVTAVDYDRRPVRGVQVEVAAGPEDWANQELHFQVEARGRVTTDDAGKAVFRFAPRSEGEYRIEARATDRLGNHILSRSSLWVTGGWYSDLHTPYPELTIVADKAMYRKGETAVLLINSQLKGATALVTVEGPRLYERRLVALKGNSTKVELPIRPEFAPNCYFCVSLVRDKRFVNQEKQIKVSVEERRLRVTVKPDKERYSPGERATYQLTTADWQGRPVPAELSVGVVDESIYALQGELIVPMLRFFYPPRENSVHTSYSSYQIYLDADKSPVTMRVRKRFPDTAYWNPRVVTGADGRGQISFLMPDTLTTWRATARGVTLATAVGEAVAKVKCSKDLLVRLEGPRFMTQKDRLTLSAVAHNYTRTRQSLSLWLEASGLAFPSGPRAGERQRFALGSDEVRRQDWQVEAPSPGSHEITAYLKAEGGLSDAMALAIPVLPHGRERVEWRTGAVAATATESLPVREDAVPGASDLRLRLAPSIASVILGALDYLAEYPYGCTEQTMSAFLPDVVVARALRELKLPHPELEQKLPDMVQSGFNRLYGYQHEDGGWGWWRYDKSDPWMTAYVVFGLITAKRSGFAVNQQFLDEGLTWLLQYVHEPAGAGAPAPARIYPLYVVSLAERDGVVDKQLLDLYRGLNSLDAPSVALLTTALLARNRSAQARVAAARLWSQSQGTQSLVFWKGGEDWGHGGDVETTALAFRALYQLQPNDPRLLRVVRWLVLNREGNHWVSTRDTAFVLFALTDFLKRSRELKPDYQAAVTLNGQRILTRRFTQADLFAPEVEVKMGGKSLRRGRNSLQLSKQGPGNLYYTLIFRQFVGQEDMTKLVTGAGISVSREYYRLESERDRRSGVITTAPAPRPTTSLRSGEAVLVRLAITSPREYEYVIVEDPIPAGCEVAEQGDLEPEEWDHWWSDVDVRDEKVAIFARRLPAGKSSIEYHLRPQIPGDYHVMPTEIYSMYNPDLRGSSAETRVSLR